MARPLLTASGLANFAPWLAAACTGCAAATWAGGGVQRHTDAARALQLRVEIATIKSEMRKGYSEHKQAMWELGSSVDTLKRKQRILDNLWDGRIERVKAEIDTFNDSGEILPWVQWQLRRLGRLLEVYASRSAHQRESGNYGQFEFISGRMASMLLAVSSEAFDTAQRVAGAKISLGRLRTVQSRDPLLNMMMASLMHLDTVPPLDGEQGVVETFGRLLDHLQREDECEIDVNPIRQAVHGFEQMSDLRVALGVCEELNEILPEYFSGRADLDQFVALATDRLIAQQALEVTGAYMTTLQLPLARSKTG
eukprot:TRINITY_DN46925_c0_g1_i1.p1 TRINITY_DN46925_c0_g1~~TRINITY_DN46925_c0_g1_i1.p1  ORF type:complete len:331 (+),score=51.80 TRINITY_DN46925_c0_g1_i1:66-995(+)